MCGAVSPLIHLIGIDEPTEIYVIAEVGINHNGDLEIAKKLIREAARVGCDAVKFQKRTINIVYSPELLAEPRESPWGTTQRAQKEGLEFSAAQYLELRNLATELGIDFSASAWDLESLEFVHDLKPEFHKVASAFITNLEFLEAVAKLKPIAEGLDLTMSQLALAWALANPNVSSVIMGASKPSQVKENVKASGVKLSTQTLSEINKALGTIPETNPERTESPNPRA
jgi:hypothetical protein